MPKILRVATVPLSFAKLIPGLVRFLVVNGYDVHMAGADGEVVAEVEQYEQAPYHRIPLTRQITPFTDLQALWQLYRLLRRFRPEIVHTETPKAGLIGMMAAWLAGVPVRVHTIAGLPLMERHGLLRQLLIRMEQLTYMCATHVYPNSAALGQYIQQTFYNRPDKLKVIGYGSTNGVDTAYFSRRPELENQAQGLRQSLGIGSDEFVWVFVGRLVRDKGIRELVEAFVTLAGSSDRSGQMRLLLVGPFEDDLDPLDPHTRQQIDNRADIITVGFQQDVRAYLVLSDVLVFPSYREGFPNVPMQAGCLDMPMILSDINGCNEIVTDGENGLLIPAHDTEALKTAMQRLFSDAALQTQFRHCVRQRIVARYAQEFIWQQWLIEYSKLLTASGIAAPKTDERTPDPPIFPAA